MLTLRKKRETQYPANTCLLRVAGPATLVFLALVGQAVFGASIASSTTNTTTPTSTTTRIASPTHMASPTATPSTGTIQGTVWTDLNGDTIREASEPGLASAQISLRHGGGTLVGLYTTTTNGTYSFPDLTPGTYSIAEADPPGYNSTTPNTWVVAVSANTTATIDFGDQFVETATATPTVTFTPTPSPTKTPMVPNRRVVFLPLVTKGWPPIPSVPALYMVNNDDQDNAFTVQWSAIEHATIYILEESQDPSFSVKWTPYEGTGLSWSTSGRTPAIYYYRVKARNAWGESPWSNVQTIRIYPLFVGLTVRWDGEGYIRGSEYYNVGWHYEITFDQLTDADTIRSTERDWYDPNPRGWDGETYFSYYSVVGGYIRSSSTPDDPSWKWGHYWWTVPYDKQFYDGQTVSIGGQPFSVSGPHSGYTSFGKAVQYWCFVNTRKFLYWNGGGDWKQYVHPGDITLWYEAGNTKLLLHGDVLRREYYKGRLTSDTVHYVTNLTSSNAFPSTGVAAQSLEKPSATTFRRTRWLDLDNHRDQRTKNLSHGDTIVSSPLGY